jgi:HlyD family secretion protein
MLTPGGKIAVSVAVLLVAVAIAFLVAAPIIGRIAEVLVRPNDRIFAGELLVRLDDSEALARLAAAEAQAALRKRVRNDASMPKGSAERRKAEDAVADAERALTEARVGLDRAAAARL